MAVARKCDICGSFYESYSVESIAFPNSFKGRNINAIMFTNLYDDRKYCSNSVFDCCTTCLTSIEELIISLRNKGDENANKT